MKQFLRVTHKPTCRLEGFALYALRLSALAPSEPVISIYVDHDREQHHHTHHLCVFQQFLTGFAARDHFQNGKEYMSAIQRGNRKNIKKASAMEKKAVMVQNDCQSHMDGKMDPIALNPPTPL